MLNRRHFLRSSALATGGLLAGLPALAANAKDRRFLFLLARGGWDTTFVFTPEQDNTSVDTEADAVLAECNGVSFVDSEARPSVRSFFELWGDRAAILNGIEVRSVTHERCERLMLTGTSDVADDWPTLIAGEAADESLMPHLVVYGSAYARDHAAAVVRLGNEGQLPDLLSGMALERSGLGAGLLTGSADAAVDALVRRRIAAASAAASPGRNRGLLDAYGRSLDTLTLLSERADSLNLSPADAGCTRDPAEDAGAVFECFEQGLSRCGMVQYDGWCGEGWDTHANNDKQSTHFELLFEALCRIFDDLSGRSSVSGGALIDEVTVVVLSEMGRHPQLNRAAGKDHWTYTSAMLVGAGVRGGQVVGEMDENFMGRTIDLHSGEGSDAGTSLLPKHLGATLLALADLDPGDYIASGEQPITALLR